MRKTSHDGADTTSITSGIDNESKKSLTSFNKMKKNSIKRKVPNFSHESDDGIIEPLLQTEKEKVEIANRSAKYLLNKSKTEPLNENESKVTDIVSSALTTIVCPTPINAIPTSNMVTNITKDDSTSTSYICGSAPIHNHMNTNVFSTYDIPTESNKAKNSVLIEIESSCRSSGCTPSPLIFTTAKIHTDCKTKVMEPIQVTPVPILSTIEGNIVKAGIVSNVGIKGSNLPNTSSFTLNNISETSEKKIGKEKIHTPPLIKSETLNSEIGHIKSKSTTIHTTPHSSEDTSNVVHKDIKLSQLANDMTTFVTLPSVGTSIKDECKTLKGQTTTGIVTDSNISSTENSKQPIEIPKFGVSNKKLEKSTLIDRSQEKLQTMENKNHSIISQDATELQNQENIHKINKKLTKPNLDDNADLSKFSGINSKKLQRQKKSSLDDSNDIVNVGSKVDKGNLMKEQDGKFHIRTDRESKLSSANTLSTLPLSIHPSNSTCTTGPTTTASKLKPIKDFASSSNIKSSPAAANLKPTLIDLSTDIHKSATKSFDTPANTTVKDGIESKTTSIKKTSPQISSPVAGKPDIKFHSSQPSQYITPGPLIKGTDVTLSTTLPSYIVSTSKTKIGSTLTSTTPATTAKTQAQTPLVSVGSTSKFEKKSTSDVDFSAPTSSSNSAKQTKSTNQTKSKSESINKDRRA